MNDLLDPLLLSRWQFGLTTIYHFLFVPLTIGMAAVVAVFQTAWYRTGRAHYLQLTRFFRRSRVASTAIAAEVHPDLDVASYTVLVTISDLSASLAGVRAIDVAEDDRLNEAALAELIRAGLAHNMSKKSKR